MQIKFKTRENVSIKKYDSLNAYYGMVGVNLL